MLTMHPTLLVGPADWGPQRMPKQEFLERIAAFWRACDPAVAGAIVYGDPRSHAELAYLTHMTPKLEACIALIPRPGGEAAHLDRDEPRLLVGGGANMVGSAKPLTWVETLGPLREPGATIARWREELGGALVVVNANAMPLRMRQGIWRALGAPAGDATGRLAAMMRRKSTRELALMQDACDDLEAAFSAMRAAQRDGKGMTDVVLAGEAAAWRHGAQDVRTLFGRDGRLAPFTVRDDTIADPLQVYVAVRHGGYWAEGSDVLSQSPQPAAETARKILDQAVARIRAGTLHSEVAAFLGEAIGTGRAHPLTERGFGNHIGLRLDEPDCLSTASTGRFAVGEVYTVRAGLRDAGESALVSTMVGVATFSGHIRKWPRERA